MLIATGCKFGSHNFLYLGSRNVWHGIVNTSRDKSKNHPYTNAKDVKRVHGLSRDLFRSCTPRTVSQVVTAQGRVLSDKHVVWHLIITRGVERDSCPNAPELVVQYTPKPAFKMLVDSLLDECGELNTIVSISG